VTDQHWNEFLEKLDLAQLTSRWSLLPLHWLDSEPPAGLDSAQEALYRGLLDLPKELQGTAKDEKVHELVRAYRQARSAQTMALNSSLTPPGSRVTLRYLDPEDLGQGDCLITVGNWDRLGHYIAEQAGLGDEPAEPSAEPVRKDPGKLAYRHLLLFPDKGTPAPRAFRGLCEKTLRQARGLGARRLTITHLHLPQPGLPDRFAAAEVVSAVRQMLRDGGGISVELLVLTAANYEDYRHWFLSLAELSRGEAEPAPAEPFVESEPSEPVLANALRDLAQKTSSLAQEAGRGVSSWFRNATAPPASSPPPAPRRMPTPALEPTFDDQQALNLLYLGRWKEAEAYSHRWEQDTLLSLYLAALHKVVAYLDQHPLPEPLSPRSPEPEENQPSAAKSGKKKAKAKKKGKAPEEPVSEEATESPAEDDVPVQEAPPPPVRESEYLQLREQLLSTAQELGAENPLARYFQLLAWRLDERLPDIDADQLEEDHARLLRAAWAYEDTALLAFLRQARQERESQPAKAAGPGYVPVFPSGSRTAPRLD
jgi:hypothetical protein